MNRHDSQSQSGQMLVLLAGALVALLALTALVLDGGNAFAQQRQTQNAADASSEAGGVVLAEWLAGATAPSTSYTGTCPTATTDQWDLAVCQSVYGAGSHDNATVSDASYTNFDGSVNLGAVGRGSLPAGAQGVRVATQKQFGTLVANIVGISQLGTAAQATSIVGAITTFCTANTVCGTLPVTFPVQTSTCAGNGKLIVGSGPWPFTSTFDAAHESIIPLCQNGPGSVGWLKWPCSTTNGTPGLIEEITTPCNSNITLPAWIPTHTGNTNDPGVQTALNAYHNKLVWLPEFDASRGNGATLEYHVTQFQAFQFDAAFTHANNNDECNQAPGQPFVGGNGSTGCLKGWWTKAIVTGTVNIGAVPQGTNETLGVQLIR